MVVSKGTRHVDPHDRERISIVDSIVDIVDVQLVFAPWAA